MSTATLLTLTAETTPTVIIEPSDVALIAEARKLNKTVQVHARKSIESFWYLGQTLASLYQRRHMVSNGRWTEVLKEVGISPTTDANARKLFARTTLDGLSEFKNQSHALRSLEIIPEL